MGDLMDFLDDFVMGPLNVIDRAEGLLSGIRYGDIGHKFAIARTDKGGAHSLSECEETLNRYGIAVYGRTHDAGRMYFRVKHRQASWAEYVLRRAGVELLSPPVDDRNAGWAARRSNMPKAWRDRQRRGRREGRGAR